MPHCPRPFNRFLNVNKPAPTSRDQLTSLDSPHPSYIHARGKEEEKTEETHHFPPNPFAKMLYGTVGAGFSNKFE
jgi:hypothetical protein